jgi:hypothetical protein
MATKTKKRAPARDILVEVTYTGGDMGVRDEKLEKIAGRRSGSSGYAFMNGERDISFTFQRAAAAEACAKRIKKACRWANVEIRDTSEDDDWN